MGVLRTALAGFAIWGAGAGWAQEPEPDPPVTLDSPHPFRPPGTLEEWTERRAFLRRQVLVSAGLWPLPERTPLEPVIHGAVHRDGYTVEKVYFASLPGHYVSGNLYRPTAGGGGGETPFAGVLSPHGHWDGGRFTELSDERGNDRWPLQARCAELARLGCVVFHYDMVGYGDSTAIPHGAGFQSSTALLGGESFLGLQLWNSIRALDFLAAQPGVDPERLGVTGASGGGTQTFLLCAVDDRPAAAFPAVMVSTRMQGGCVCENAPYLRLDTGNVELAALFAPKPLALSGADDWTIAIETEGLPQLKAVWKLYGAEDRVTARAWPEYPHNFNHAARAMMVHWFNRHLDLGHEEPIVERPIQPLGREELAVFGADHPRPADDGGLEAVHRWWQDQRERPLDEAERRAALEVILGPSREPPASEATAQIVVVVAAAPELARTWERDLEALGLEARAVAPSPPAAVDGRRHGDYAGYSWCYNPTSIVLRARGIRDMLLGARGAEAVRLLASPAETAAAELALASVAEAAGVDLALLGQDPEPEGLDHRDLLPGRERFRFDALLDPGPATVLRYGDGPPPPDLMERLAQEGPQQRR